jgi:excisionase family DNA binding protein
VETRFVTMRELARMLGVSEKTVKLWRKRGAIPSVKIARTVRIPLDELEQRLAAQLHPHQEQSDA